MKEKNKELNKQVNSSFGLKIQSKLHAGYNCPPGWWKYNENKARMCCHWVYNPRFRNYQVECTQ